MGYDTEAPLTLPMVDRFTGLLGVPTPSRPERRVVLDCLFARVMGVEAALAGGDCCMTHVGTGSGRMPDCCARVSFETHLTYTFLGLFVVNGAQGLSGSDHQLVVRN